MSHKYKVIDSTAPTFVTITVLDWVDVFIRPTYFRILDDSDVWEIYIEWR